MNDEAPAEQGSAQWLYERCGNCTASRFADAIGRIKSGAYSAARETYIWEIVIERITGQPSDHWTSTAMLWGSSNEAMARMEYEARTGAFVEAVGFVKHSTLPNVGGSPDGIMGDAGLLEIKCPYNSANHLKAIMGGMPIEHAAQVQGNLWITGRQWADFVSYDPRLPAPYDIYIERIERDADFIAKMEAEIILFDAAITEMLAKLSEAAA